MGNPVPSDPQWLTLHQIDDGLVSYGHHQWWAEGSLRDVKVTGQVNRLWQLGLVTFPAQLDDGAKPAVSAEGQIVLNRRSVYDVLERVNRRQR